MRTIALNEDWEPIVTSSGTLKVVEGAEALAQYIKQALLLWEEEYWLERDRGVDYSAIFSGKGTPDRSYFINRVEGLGYGIVVTEYNATINKRTRRLRVRMRMSSDLGEIEI